MDLVLATRNPGKVAEMRDLLADTNLDVRSLDAYPDAPAVVEDSPTLRGNALKKARAVFVHTGLPALADDTGLEVDALGGRPGVHSARYAGDDGNAAANCRKLLEELAGIVDRSARFRTVVALVDADGVQLFEGVCEGEILTAPRGQGGFGYDPLFQPVKSNESFAEMTAAAKNEVSHRGQALAKVVSYLEGRIGFRSEQT